MRGGPPTTPRPRPLPAYDCAGVAGRRVSAAQPQPPRGWPAAAHHTTHPHRRERLGRRRRPAAGTAVVCGSGRIQFGDALLCFSIPFRYCSARGPRQVCWCELRGREGQRVNWTSHTIPHVQYCTYMKETPRTAPRPPPPPRRRRRTHRQRTHSAATLGSPQPRTRARARRG